MFDYRIPEAPSKVLARPVPPRVCCSHFLGRLPLSIILIVLSAFGPMTEVRVCSAAADRGNSVRTVEEEEASAGAERAKPRQDGSQKRGMVQWVPWGKEAFDRAKRERRLILLDLTAVWCHACHVMDRTTYSDPEIANLLNARFVPVRVDTDRRPDIEARYRQGGWPTTSVLLDTGEIIFQANFLDPAEMRLVLAETEASYRQHGGELKKRAAEVWAKVHASREDIAPPTSQIENTMVDRALRAMHIRFDPKHGGFRRAPKFFESDAIAFGFLQYHKTQDPDLKFMLVKTLDEQLHLYDPVWGGFYRYAEREDWTKPHYEKMLHIQARNLHNYLEAYQVTGEVRYKIVAEGVIGYVKRFLSGVTPSGFYSSHSGTPAEGDPANAPITGDDYFLLGEVERTKLGIPPVDRAVYTHSNGLMIASYLQAARVLGNAETRHVAIRTLNHLHHERYKAEVGMAHVMIQGAPQGFGYLADQVSFAQALVEAFQTTGESTYLASAEQLVGDLRRQLEDDKGGGFFDRPQGQVDQGLLRFLHKPVQENLYASLLLSDLYYLTSNLAYREAAGRTLQFVIGLEQPLPVALVGTAVDHFLNHPISVVVVGPRADTVTQALWREALRIYAPRKLVWLLDPRRDVLRVGEVKFPYAEEPQAYVCTDRFCSKPVGVPEVLEEQLSVVVTASSQSSRGRKPGITDQ